VTRVADEQNTTLSFLEDLAKRLEKGTLDLPPCPQIALKIRELLARDDVSASQVANFALMDPVLTARIFKLANSAAFSRSATPTTELKSAIGRVGFDMVKSLAFEIALDSAFKLDARSGLGGLSNAIRIHSRQVAVLAYFLAKRCASALKADEPMLGGLLHEVGKLYILGRADAYPALFADPDTLDQLLEEWHAAIGHAIVEAWALPEAVVQAISEQEVADVVRYGTISVSEVLSAAILLSRVPAVDSEEHIDALVHLPAFTRLKLDAVTCRVLSSKSREMADSVATVLAP
jgi:HD-like signal output (HDOD) protein